jgi:hypothetical protein
MRSRWRAVAVVLLVALLAPARAQAATPERSEWVRVRALPPGRKLSVHLRDGTVRKGALLAATEDGLVLRVTGGPALIPRADVRLVRNARRSVGRKVAGFLIGAVVGALGGTGLGGAIGASGCQNYCEDAGLIGAFFGFVGGIVLGGLFGLAIAAQGEGSVVYVSAGAAPS